MAVTRRLAEREELSHKGDAGTQVFLVVAGRLKASASSSAGQEVVFSILGPGDVVGELALFSRGRRTATVMALEPSELVVFEGCEVRRILRSKPDAALRLLEILAGRLRRTSERIEDQAFLGVRARLAKTLLELSRRFGEPTADGHRIELRLSQEELGVMVSATRESVNKHLREWTRDGVVSTDRGWMTLHAPDRLAALLPERREESS